MISLKFALNCENKGVKIILIAITTHTIWKERNNFKHNLGTRIANQIGLVRKIGAKLKGRLNYESRRTGDIVIRNDLRMIVGKFDSFFATASRALPN